MVRWSHLGQHGRGLVDVADVGGGDACDVRSAAEVCHEESQRESESERERQRQRQTATETETETETETARERDLA